MRKYAYLAFILLAVAAAAAQQPRSHWAKFGETRIRYYDIGDTKKKDALVLVHCWTCNAEFWKDSMNAFPNYRVIVLDLPGHGQSDKPKVDYSMEFFARSVDAVMQQAKVQHAVLVGHSMGTPVIRQYYRLFPEKTLGLVVVDGALRPFGPKAEVEKFFQPLFTNYKENAPKFIDGILGPAPADLKQQIKTSMLATPDYVGSSSMKGMLDDRIWGDDQIKVQVLAVMATGQWPANIEELDRAIAPKLEFHMWTGVSHFLMMEKPKEFNEAVNTFVSKNRLLK
jgi:pimeloyl-ACP methyl ester carboxylesterase